MTELKVALQSRQFVTISSGSHPEIVLISFFVTITCELKRVSKKFAFVLNCKEGRNDVSAIDSDILNKLLIPLMADALAASPFRNSISPSTKHIIAIIINDESRRP